MEAVQPAPSIDLGIAEVIATHERACNQHDPELLISLFDDTLDFVNVVGVHHRSKESFRRELQHLHTTFMRNSRIRMQAHGARFLAPGVALAHSHWEMTGVDKVPGWNVAETRRGVMTYVLVKRGDQWKVTAAQNTDVIDIPLPK